MFIELHVFNDPQPFLISVAHIIRVKPKGKGGSVIEYADPKDSTVHVTESYEEIRSKLLSAGAKEAPRSGK